VDACLRSPELTYALVWGVSANTRRTWSLDSARALGYAPQDDAERYADQVSGPDPSDAYVGGAFTTDRFDIDRFSDGAGDG
jgi:uronate dehydrogenase